MTMIEKPLALIDMDGTLADFASALTARIKELASPNEEPGPWIKARSRLVKNTPGFWLGLERLPVGFAILERVMAAGFDTHVLTKGPNNAANAWTEKLQWCARHLPDVPVTITKEKSLVYGRVLVDDWPPYFEGWLNRRPRGLVIIPAQPWNEGYEHPNAIRCDGSVKSLNEVTARLVQARDRINEATK